MANYGDTSYGAVTTYASGATYQPSTSEILGGIAGTLGKVGAVVPQGGGAGQAPIVNDIMGAISIAGGVAELGAAAAETFGSGGALGPIAIMQAAGGLAQIAQGVTSIAGYGGSAQAGGLTSAQAGQLSQAAQAGAGFNPDGTPNAAKWAAQACAPWSCQEPGCGVTYGELLRQVSWTLQQLAFAGCFATGPRSVFQFFSHVTHSASPTLTLPLFPVPNIRETDDLITFLNRESGYSTWSTSGSPIGGYYATFDHSAAATYVCGLLPWEFDALKYYLYTPSSGPPVRHILGDLNQLLALIPVVY